MSKVSMSGLVTMIHNNRGSKDVTREMIIADMIEKKVLIDGKTATPFGMQFGISERHSDVYSSTWLVFNEEIQMYYLQHSDELVAKYGSIKAKVAARKKKEKAARDAEKAKAAPKSTGTRSPRSLPQKTGTHFPYLGLDDFVVVDTETTGLTETDEIVELSIVGMDGSELYHNYFMPTCEFNPQASAVNHLSKRVLEKKGAVSFRNEYETICALLADKMVLGHNIPFDIKMLNGTARVYGLDPDALRIAGTYDSRIIAKQWMKADNYKLETLAHIVGIERDEQHDATDDCRMTIEFMEHLESQIAELVAVREKYPYLNL